MEFNLLTDCDTCGEISACAEIPGGGTICGSCHMDELNGLTPEKKREIAEAEEAELRRKWFV